MKPVGPSAGARARCPGCLDYCVPRGYPAGGPSNFERPFYFRNGEGTVNKITRASLQTTDFESLLPLMERARHVSAASFASSRWQGPRDRPSCAC